MLLLCLPFPGGALSAAEPASLQIGDGSQWAFVNSQWKDTEAGGIVGERTGDGDGLQGYCLAFLKDRDYTDLEATFTVQMNTNHADEGLIVRAQDPTRFVLIHFPQTGQQLRDGTLLRFCYGLHSTSTEPVGFETKDGRIMCLIRPIYSPWMWETWSEDQGKSWSPSVRGPFPGWAQSAPVRTKSGVVVLLALAES